MGIDAGFDMVPRLSKGAVDRQNWQSFIKIIRKRYENDDVVEVKPKYSVQSRRASAASLRGS